ncbi:hypothetical protein RKD28_002675 [Streptomyces sp. SAI-229]
MVLKHWNWSAGDDLPGHRLHFGDRVGGLDREAGRVAGRGTAGGGLELLALLGFLLRLLRLVGRFLLLRDRGLGGGLAGGLLGVLLGARVRGDGHRFGLLRQGRGLHLGLLARGDVREQRGAACRRFGVVVLRGAARGNADDTSDSGDRRGRGHCESPDRDPAHTVSFQHRPLR